MTTVVKYMSIKQAAATMGLSRSAVDCEIKARRLGCVRIAGRRYLTQEHLAAFQKLADECSDEPLKREQLVDRTPKPLVRSNAAVEREASASVDALQAMLAERRTRTKQTTGK